jgi:N-acylneuraminate cytidylyltransferase
MNNRRSFGTLALIPARGGSKSIPKKNIRPFCGKPLVAYSIETALVCPSVDRVVVSSDDSDIIGVAREYGAEVPFTRPKKLAEDDTPDLPVFLHCLEFLKEHEGYEPDIIVQLRPTSPLRTVEMIEKGIKLLIDNSEADSVRTVCKPSQNPYKMWKFSDNGFLHPLLDTDIKDPYNQPRQNLPDVYWQNGYVDVTRRTTILEKNSMTGDRILPLVVDSQEIVDIDNEITFRLAESIFLSRNRRGTS